MSVAPTPRVPVRLAYQPLDGYRHDVWQFRARVAVVIAACALALAAAAAARSGLRKWQAQRAQARAAWAQHRAVLADEDLCMSYTAPPTQAVYSEPQGETIAMLRQPDCVPVEWTVEPKMCGVVTTEEFRGVWRRPKPDPDPDPGPFTAAARFPEPLRDYPVVALGTAFLGVRRSAGGTQRLVAVGVSPSNSPAAQKARWLKFVAQSFSPAGPRPGQLPAPGQASYYDVPVAAGHYARVLAGQRDASDPAAFTIVYELGGIPATLAGRLHDDGSVSLRPVE